MYEAATTNIARWRYFPLAAKYNGVGNLQRDVLVADGPAIGERVMDHLKRREWSLGMLAERSGLNKGYLSQLTRGRVDNPGATTLGKIAAALRVPLSELTGERPMAPRQEQVLEGAVGLPVLKRRVHAGGESYWDDTPDTVWVPRQFRDRYPRARVAIVDGSCMSPHIDAGEKILFDPDQMPVNGQMVVVTTDEGQTLLKWFRLDEDGRPFLRSADGQELRPNGAIVEGVVIEVRKGAIRDPEA